jgi:hypothetical protein
MGTIESDRIGLRFECDKIHYHVLLLERRAEKRSVVQSLPDADTNRADVSSATTGVFLVKDGKCGLESHVPHKAALLC